MCKTYKDSEDSEFKFRKTSHKKMVPYKRNSKHKSLDTNEIQIRRIYST